MGGAGIGGLAVIRVQGTVQAGAFTLGPVDLQVPAGVYGVLMGPTGCGKTTVLETIAGLTPLRDGRVELAGRDVTYAPPGQRGIGYVPQDGALFATMRVGEQIGFAPSVQGWPKERIRTRVQELARSMGIAGLLDRGVHHLSGGERQRVALARALAAEPKVLLLDEPLSALDTATHDAMCDLLAEIHQTHGVTVLHVTHSSREAALLGERRFAIHEGTLRVVEHDEQAAGQR